MTRPSEIARKLRAAMQAHRRVRLAAGIARRSLATFRCGDVTFTEWAIRDGLLPGQVRTEWRAEHLAVGFDRREFVTVGHEPDGTPIRKPQDTVWATFDGQRLARKFSSLRAAMHGAIAARMRQASKGRAAA